MKTKNKKIILILLVLIAVFALALAIASFGFFFDRQSSSNLTDLEQKHIYLTTEEKRTRFRNQIERLPINDELAQALRIQPSYTGLELAGTYPGYHLMNNEEIKNAFRTYILSVWEVGFELAGPTTDLNVSLQKWNNALNPLGDWGQSPYLSEENVAHWQSAFLLGKEIIYDYLEIIEDEQIKSELKNYLDVYYQRDFFIMLELGHVNQTVDPIPDVPKAR